MFHSSVKHHKPWLYILSRVLKLNQINDLAELAWDLHSFLKDLGLKGGFGLIKTVLEKGFKELYLTPPTPPFHFDTIHSPDSLKKIPKNISESKKPTKPIN